MVHRFITARQAGDESNHEWVLRVEKLSDGVAYDRQECMSPAIAMVIAGLRSYAVKLSILFKQEEWMWEALHNFYQAGGQCTKCSRNHKGGYRYSVVSRWSQNEGF